MSDKKRFFDKHAAPPHYKMIEGERPERGPYKAYGMETQGDQAGKFLRIEFPNGDVQLMPKWQLMEVLCSSHAAITLVYSHCYIQLLGSDLEGLLDLLQREEVATLHGYHSERYLPEEEGMPFIKEIERTMWPIVSVTDASTERSAKSAPAWATTGNL